VAKSRQSRRAPGERFDRAYYERFYLNSRTAVTSRTEMRARARLITAFVDHIGLPVRRVLDAGCGIGLLRASLKRNWPRVDYVGLETSEFLCTRYGWQRGSLTNWRASEAFDLVICYDVLQYLDDRDAARALANLGRLCRGVLYTTALTTQDWQRNCDQSRTDQDVYLRSGDWYRQRLRRSFRPVGAGLWLRRGAPLITWELEVA